MNNLQGAAPTWMPVNLDKKPVDHPMAIDRFDKCLWTPLASRQKERQPARHSSVQDQAES